MFSIEVLDDLRVLNDLRREAKLLAVDSPQGMANARREAALRAELPREVVRFHDQMTRRGGFSVVALNGASCGGCHLRLPAVTLSSLRLPERFAPCPHCGTFIWSGAGEPAPTVPTARPPRAARPVAAG